MSSTGVCAQCAPRGLLLARLGGHIGTAVERGAGRRARDLLSLGDEELARSVAGGRLAAGEAVSWSRSRETLRALARSLEASGCWMLCRHDSGWPRELTRLQDAEPRALFARGARPRSLGGEAGGSASLRSNASGSPERPTVTIVGARRAGAYGREVAEALGYGLGAAAVGVISGLAMGIDAAVHEGIVRAGAAGVAVLAAGPDRAHPRSAATVYRELIAAGGTVISELPPGSAVRRWMFPARNRLMAALGEITVVVEAAERSGSLITAEMAGDCGRMVGAVPGPVNSWRSSGTNMLLVDGAVPIRGAADVLEHLYGAGAGALLPRGPIGPRLAGRERSVLDAIERGATSADAVATASGLGGAASAAALARLELAGYISVDVAGRSRRTLLEVPPENRSAPNTIDG